MEPDNSDWCVVNTDDESTDSKSKSPDQDGVDSKSSSEIETFQEKSDDSENFEYDTAEEYEVVDEASEKGSPASEGPECDSDNFDMHNYALKLTEKTIEQPTISDPVQFSPANKDFAAVDKSKDVESNFSKEDWSNIIEEKKSNAEKKEDDTVNEKKDGMIAGKKKIMKERAEDEVAGEKEEGEAIIRKKGEVAGKKKEVDIPGEKKDIGIIGKKKEGIVSTQKEDAATDKKKDRVIGKVEEEKILDIKKEADAVEKKNEALTDKRKEVEVVGKMTEVDMPDERKKDETTDKKEETSRTGKQKADVVADKNKENQATGQKKGEIISKRKDEVAGKTEDDVYGKQKDDELSGKKKEKLAGKQKEDEGKVKKIEDKIIDKKKTNVTYKSKEVIDKKTEIELTGEKKAIETHCKMKEDEVFSKVKEDEIPSKTEKSDIRSKKKGEISSKIIQDEVSRKMMETEGPSKYKIHSKMKDEVPSTKQEDRVLSKKKEEQVPIKNKDDDISRKRKKDAVTGRKKEDEVLNRKRKHEVLGKKTEAELSKKMKVGDEVPSKMKEDEVTSKKKEDEVPSKKKENEMPSKKKENEVPSKKKDDEVPSKKKVDEVHGKKKEDEVASKKKGDIPSKKKDEVLGRKKEDEVHSKKKEDEIPSKKKEDEVPSKKKEDEVPSKKKEDEVTSKKKEDEVPSKKKEDEVTSKKEDKVSGRKKETEVPRKEREHEVLNKKKEGITGEEKEAVLTKKREENILSKKKKVEVLSRKTDDEVLSKKKKDEVSDKKTEIEVPDKTRKVVVPSKKKEEITSQKADDVLRKKNDEVPSKKKEDIHSKKKEAEVPKESKEIEVPSKRKEEEILEKQKQDIVLSKKKDDVLRKQKEDEVLSKKKDEVAKKMKEGEVPRKKKDEKLSKKKDDVLSKEKYEMSIKKKESGVHSEMTGDEVPSKKDVLSRKKEDDVPRKKKEDKVLSKKKDEVPSRKKEDQVPDKKKEDQVSSKKKGQVPSKKNEDELPRKKKEEDALAKKKEDEVPRKKKDVPSRKKEDRVSYKKKEYQIPSKKHEEEIRSKKKEEEKQEVPAIKKEDVVSSKKKEDKVLSEKKKDQISSKTKDEVPSKKIEEVAHKNKEAEIVDKDEEDEVVVEKVYTVAGKKDVVSIKEKEDEELEYNSSLEDLEDEIFEIVSESESSSEIYEIIEESNGEEDDQLTEFDESDRQVIQQIIDYIIDEIVISQMLFLETVTEETESSESESSSVSLLSYTEAELSEEDETGANYESKKISVKVKKHKAQVTFEMMMSKFRYLDERFSTRNQCYALCLRYHNVKMNFFSSISAETHHTYFTGFWAVRKELLQLKSKMKSQENAVVVETNSLTRKPELLRLFTEGSHGGIEEYSPSQEVIIIDEEEQAELTILDENGVSEVAESVHMDVCLRELDTYQVSQRNYDNYLQQSFMKSLEKLFRKGDKNSQEEEDFLDICLSECMKDLDIDEQSKEFCDTKRSMLAALSDFETWINCEKMASLTADEFINSEVINSFDNLISDHKSEQKTAKPSLSFDWFNNVSLDTPESKSQINQFKLYIILITKKGSIHAFSKLCIFVRQLFQIMLFAPFIVHLSCCEFSEVSGTDRQWRCLALIQALMLNPNCYFLVKEWYKIVDFMVYCLGTANIFAVEHLQFRYFAGRIMGEILNDKLSFERIIMHNAFLKYVIVRFENMTTINCHFSCGIIDTILSMGFFAIQYLIPKLFPKLCEMLKTSLNIFKYETEDIFRIITDYCFNADDYCTQTNSFEISNSLLKFIDSVCEQKVVNCEVPPEIYMLKPDVVKSKFSAHVNAEMLRSYDAFYLYEKVLTACEILIRDFINEISDEDLPHVKSGKDDLPPFMRKYKMNDKEFKNFVNDCFSFFGESLTCRLNVVCTQDNFQRYLDNLFQKSGLIMHNDKLMDCDSAVHLSLNRNNQNLFKKVNKIKFPVSFEAVKYLFGDVRCGEMLPFVKKPDEKKNAKKQSASGKKVKLSEQTKSSKVYSKPDSECVKELMDFMLNEVCLEEQFFASALYQYPKPICDANLNVPELLSEKGKVSIVESKKKCIESVLEEISHKIYVSTISTEFAVHQKHILAEGAKSLLTEEEKTLGTFKIYEESSGMYLNSEGVLNENKTKKHDGKLKFRDPKCIVEKLDDEKSIKNCMSSLLNKLDQDKSRSLPALDDDIKQTSVEGSPKKQKEKCSITSPAKQETIIIEMDLTKDTEEEQCEERKSKDNQNELKKSLEQRSTELLDDTINVYPITPSLQNIDSLHEKSHSDECTDSNKSNREQNFPESLFDFEDGGVLHILTEKKKEHSLRLNDISKGYVTCEIELMNSFNALAEEMFEIGNKSEFECMRFIKVLIRRLNKENSNAIYAHIGDRIAIVTKAITPESTIFKDFGSLSFPSRKIKFSKCPEAVSEEIFQKLDQRTAFEFALYLFGQINNPDVLLECIDFLYNKLNGKLGDSFCETSEQSSTSSLRKESESDSESEPFDSEDGAFFLKAFEDLHPETRTKQLQEYLKSLQIPPPIPKVWLDKLSQKYKAGCQQKPKNLQFHELLKVVL